LIRTNAVGILIKLCDSWSLYQPTPATGLEWPGSLCSNL
jgi:hypothetical protein